MGIHFGWLFIMFSFTLWLDQRSPKSTRIATQRYKSLQKSHWQRAFPLRFTLDCSLLPLGPYLLRQYPFDIVQGSLYYRTKQCIIIRKIHENYHKFALFDSPQIGNWMTPVVSQGSDVAEVLKHLFELWRLDSSQQCRVSFCSVKGGMAKWNPDQAIGFKACTPKA